MQISAAFYISQSLLHYLLEMFIVNLPHFLNVNDCVNAPPPHGVCFTR